MAIIVETGTGAIDSEVLCSVAFCDTYHAARGNAAWAALVLADKEAALRRGYAYMQQAYRMRWAGFRFTQTQALDWPRQQVSRADVYSGYAGNLGRVGNYYPFDAIPNEIQQAQAELALKAVSGDLLADIDPPVASESVGPISVSYFQGDTKTKKYPAIDRLLAPFLQGGGNIKLVRG